MCHVSEPGAMTGEERDQYLQPIIRSAQKMDHIIRDLLLLAEIRKEEVVVAPVDMQLTVHEALARLAHEVEACEAEISLPEAWPAALGQPGGGRFSQRARTKHPSASRARRPRPRALRSPALSAQDHL